MPLLLFLLSGKIALINRLRLNDGGSLKQAKTLVRGPKQNSFGYWALAHELWKSTLATVPVPDRPVLSTNCGSDE